ncbi:MAG: U32 family peptidase [Roseburia sp.]|nr:U32 family peptidase [Roseburia sp.]
MQIVAPAGSFSALRAAVNAGADAVYLGMPKFGARAKAQNFDFDTLRTAVDYAHIFGTEVFVTLNTLIKDGEMSDALEAARFARDCGVDAAIVQDIRFIKALKNACPDLPLHASTQMGIHNADGAKAVLDMGIRRAVLSRETLPSDIAEIKKTGIIIEFFVQGALCIAFSGNCYFSSLASSYSGNRGKCMQLCRKKYSFNGKTGYFLSAKDICIYDKLAYLEQLGVDAVKIEGRMRSDEYVYQAVKVYKSALPPAQAREALKTVFNRGDYCTAHLEKNAPFDIVYPKAQANIGVSVGKIDKVRGNIISVNGATVHADDGFKVMRDGTEVCGAFVRGGDIVADGVCRSGDELRRTFDGKLSEDIRKADRRINVDVNVSVFDGRYPSVVLTADGAPPVEVVGRYMPQSAVTSGITVEDIRRVFGKVGDFPFAPNISANIGSSVFMPISALNELRRSAYDELKTHLSEQHKPKRTVSEYREPSYNKFRGSGTMLMIEKADRIDAEITRSVDWLVLNPRDYNDFDIPKTDIPILLNLPIVMRGDDREAIVRAVARDGIYGAVSNNAYGFNITDKPILLGVGHNIIGDTDLPHIRSFEADSLSKTDFVYAFGYAPVMTFCHCPYGKCVKCSGDDVLTDEKNRKFALRKYKIAHCYYQLFNCVPHDLRDISDYPNKFYDCTRLSARDTLRALRGEKVCSDFTRGNINKGLK